MFRIKDPDPNIKLSWDLASPRQEYKFWKWICLKWFIVLPVYLFHSICVDEAEGIGHSWWSDNQSYYAPPVFPSDSLIAKHFCKVLRCVGRGLGVFLPLKVCISKLSSKWWLTTNGIHASFYRHNGNPKVHKNLDLLAKSL